MAETEQITGPFRVKGEFDDEITLQFDDGEKFYVSSTFLKMASPVFKTMLESDFKEKQTGVIELKEKSSSDFLDFLLFLHPYNHKPLTEKTVYKVLALADEYQVKSPVEASKPTLFTILEEVAKQTTQLQKTGVVTVYLQQCEALARGLGVLQAASSYSIEDVEERALCILSEFPSTTYLKKHVSTVYNEERSFVEFFSSLSEKTKVKLLQKRLQKTEVETKLYERGYSIAW